MGNHVNANGMALFELTVGKDGRIANAKAISGHPLALSLLTGAMDKWLFKPLVRNETARQGCPWQKSRTTELSETTIPTACVVA